MKILILGASGMLGNIVSYYFKKKYFKETILFSRSRTNINALDKILVKIPDYSKTQLSSLIKQHRPCRVINCVSVNDINASKEDLDLINSQLPKLLVDILDAKNDNSQLIHISTNGVFSGDKGQYVETDSTNPINSYGKSKLKGEVTHAPHITIRTSIIGHKSKSDKGLLGWFLNQENQINGYTKVEWNGVTTLECAKFIDWVICKKLNGIVHLFSKKISKYDLLNIAKQVYKKDIKIVADNSIKSDLTLDTKRPDVNYVTPNHLKMLEELKGVSFLNF